MNRLKNFDGFIKIKKMVDDVDYLVKDLEVFELLFHRDGPRVEIKINIKDLTFNSDNLKDCNSLIVNLGLFGVSNVQLNYWSTDNAVVCLGFNEYFEVNFSDGFFRCDVQSIKIVSVHPYCNEC